MTRSKLGIALALPAMLAAQGGQASPPQTTMRATTRLVEVTVIAQGKHGVPLRDLKQENFRIFDEGKPQKIGFFSLSAPAAEAPAPEPGPVAAPATTTTLVTYSNRAEVASGTSPPTVILIDPMNTGWTDQVYVKQAVLGFLRQIQPADRVGIYAIRWPGYLRILYDLTQDSAELVRRVTAWRPDLDAVGGSGPLKGSDPMEGVVDFLSQSGSDDLSGLRNFAGFLPSHNTRGGYAQMIDHTQVSLLLFAAAARHLAAIPGRKNLIWVSAGFLLIPQHGDYDALRDAMNVLNSAGVALYAVDARGLQTLQADATARPPLTAGGARTFNPRWAQRIGRTDNTMLERTQAPMLEMSGLTGGRAFLNTNDIQGAIRTAADESSVCYTLGFYPDSPRHDGKFHRIEVKIAGRQDVSTRYRRGYTDAPDPANDPEGRTVAIRDAAWSPLNATAVALRAQVVPTAANRYELRLRIDPRTLDLEETHGQYTGRVDVVVLQEDHEDNQFNQSIETVVLALKPESYKKALADGLEYGRAIEPNEQAAALKIIVRDAFSGNLGSLTIPIKALRAAN